jgi:hypothetical protein
MSTTETMTMTKLWKMSRGAVANTHIVVVGAVELVLMPPEETSEKKAKNQEKGVQMVPERR